MKFLATFVLLAVVALVAAQQLTPEQKAKAEAIAKDCIKETGASEEIIKGTAKGDFSQVGDKEKCFAKCCQTKLGYVSNGVIKTDAIQKSLGPLVGEEKVKAIQAKCNGLKGANDCDTAFQVHKCYFAEHANLSA